MRIEEHKDTFIWECPKRHISKGLDYIVRIEELALEDDSGEEYTTFYSYSYIRQPEESGRSVAFCYNGGPGADSSWIHIGMLGPKVIRFPKYPDGDCRTEYTLEENKSFLLDVCDIVLIDPTGTSYSRLVKKEAEGHCYSTGGDAEGFAKFIDKWLRKYHREKSPVYLIGESYGTIRNIAVADVLPDYVNLKGIISIGTSFNVGAKTTLLVEPNVRRLGANAAGCWYHYHSDECEQEEFIESALEFAYGDYAHALLLGNLIDDDERSSVLDRLTLYSGLDRNILDKQNLRFSEMDYMTGLIPGKMISMYDSRLTDEIGSVSDMQVTDLSREPFFAIVDKPIRKCFREYCESELSGPDDRKPASAMFDIAMKWDFAGYDRDTVSLPAELMSRNPDLRIMFINGRYDLSSTFDFVRYYLSQYDLPKERVSVHVYEGGHATYIGGNMPDLVSEDIREFILGGVK